MTEKASELERKRLLSGFECPEGYFKRRSGNDSMMDTPVPIPNTVVKLTSAHNTWLETAREDRWLPDLIKKI